MKLVDILASELKHWPSTRTAAVGQSNSGSLHLNEEPRHGSEFFGWTTCKFTMAEDCQSAWVTRDEWQAAVDALNAPKVVEPEIDWSRQPEGFPLWLEGTTAEHRNHNGWYRDSGQIFEGADGGQWRSVREGQFFTVHRKPEQKVVEWDGVSLPEKGTAVEVRFACEKIGSEWPWHSGIVVASGPQPEGGVMVAVEANGFTVALRVTSDFIRPARTAEQVAAEERTAAAYGMCAIAPSLSNVDAIALYDASYRKQVLK